MNFKLFREIDICIYWLIEKRVSELSAFYEKIDGSIPVKTEKLIGILEGMIKADIDLELFPDKQEDGKPYGRLFHNDRGGFKIVIGEYDHPFEQRLTICHEIAHIFVGGSDWWDGGNNKKFVPYFVNYKFTEGICNEIALHILLPPIKLDNYLRRPFSDLSLQLDLFQENIPIRKRLELIANKFEIPVKELIKQIIILKRKEKLKARFQERDFLLKDKERIEENISKIDRQIKNDNAYFEVLLNSK